MLFYLMEFTFATLLVTHAPYVLKNEKFLKNVVCYLSIGHYNGTVFLSVSAT
jgi:hypothetical protein